MSELILPPPLPRTFYEQPTLDLARDLLGKTLWRRAAEGVVGGMIVETEGYIATIDPASHNFGRPAPRAMTMFGPPGHAYVYFTYGMYCCFNVAAEPEGISGGVLIRAIAPLFGEELMARRGPPTRKLRDLARGPARLCQAFAISLADNGRDLTGDALWISDAPTIGPQRIGVSARIGITRGVELPWRFFVKDSPAVSGTKKINTSGQIE